VFKKGGLKMTLQELNESVKKLESECKKSISKVYQKYAEENALFKVGDLIKDKTDTGIVLGYDWSLYGDNPRFVYKCEKAKVDGSKRVKSEHCYIGFLEAKKFMRKGCVYERE
jgi:hypothetical protein